jgi:WD40 repeat protein
VTRGHGFAFAAAFFNGKSPAMLACRRQAIAGLVLVLGVLADGPVSARDEPTTPPEGQTARLDLHGDPLPAGAVARLGTRRWWHGRDHDCPLAFTRDGKCLASCDAGKAVRFLDAATGKELRRVEPAGDDITTFALAPDGRTLVTASFRSGVLRLWDVPTAKELRQLPGDPKGTSAVAFSNDGKAFAAATGDQVVRLWDTAEWRETRRLQTGWLDSIVLSPDGKTLVSAGDGIRWWDVATGRETRRLDKKLAHHRRLHLSADGKRLAAVVKPGALHLWDATSGDETGQVVLGSGEGFWCVCFSPDGRSLACAGRFADRKEPETRFFAADTGRELRRWEQDGGGGALAFSPDGKTLARVSDWRIQLRDALTGKPVGQVTGLPDDILSVVFAPDGKALSASCRGGQTGRWDPFTGKPMRPLQDPPEGFAGRSQMLLGAALADDGTKAALVDAKGVLHVWETATGKALCRIDQPPVGEDQADFSPGGTALVVKHSDDIIRVWDSTTGKLRCALPPFGNRRFPHPHAFSPDGRLLATAPSSLDLNVIRLWEAATGKEAGQLAWPDKVTPTRVTFSPDSRTLVAAFGGHDEMLVREGISLRLWDLASGRELRRFAVRSNDIRSVVISPDGKTLAAADHDTVVLWELASGQERGRFRGHRDWIWSLAFSPDGRLLASGSLDYTALVWDVTGVCPEGKWAPRNVGKEGLDRLWDEVAGADGVRAHRAVWAMAAARQAVPFLAERLRPVTRVEDERLTRLIAELDGEQFEERRRASAELQRLGELAEPALRKALAGKPSPEARRQLEVLLNKVEGRTLSPERSRSPPDLSAPATAVKY